MASLHARKPLFSFLFILCAALLPLSSIAEPASGVVTSVKTDAATMPSAGTLLSRLVSAVRTENYTGRLTYEHSGKLEVMEVAHGVIEGEEFEKVSYLNGPYRGVIKSGRKSDCATLGSHLFTGGNVAERELPIALRNIYQARVLGTERVAGRPAWILQLQPKDEFRHGLIIAIDQATYLPTKSLVISAAGKVLERLHFVSLQLVSSFNKAFFNATKEDKQVADRCFEYLSIKSQALLRPAWVPQGFVLSNYRHSQEDGHMETYSDGLASFSVFTKQIKKPRKPALNIKAAQDAAANTSGVINRRAMKGATLILIRTLVNQRPLTQVSVIGEIPNATANRIIASVKAI
ncbi:MAG: MucB/RseB C-terminal domain-containing protein [Agarilytica sp.]